MKIKNFETYNESIESTEGIIDKDMIEDQFLRLKEVYGYLIYIDSSKNECEISICIPDESFPDITDESYVRKISDIWTNVSTEIKNFYDRLKSEYENLIEIEVSTRDFNSDFSINLKLISNKIILNSEEDLRNHIHEMKSYLFKNFEFKKNIDDVYFSENSAFRRGKPNTENLKISYNNRNSEISESEMTNKIKKYIGGITYTDGSKVFEYERKDFSQYRNAHVLHLKILKNKEGK